MFSFQNVKLIVSKKVSYTTTPSYNTYRELYEFKMTPKLTQLLEKADNNKKGTLRTWKVEHPHNLLQWMRVHFTYSSNALEGNSVTLGDMVQLVENGLTIGTYFS
jgi:hypothetical protein